MGWLNTKPPVVRTLDFPPGYEFKFKITNPRARTSIFGSWFFDYQWTLYLDGTVVKTATYCMRVDDNVKDIMENVAYNEAADHFNEAQALNAMPYEEGKTYTVSGTIEMKSYLTYKEWPKV